MDDLPALSDLTIDWSKNLLQERFWESRDVSIQSQTPAFSLSEDLQWWDIQEGREKRNQRLLSGYSHESEFSPMYDHGLALRSKVHMTHQLPALDLPSKKEQTKHLKEKSERDSAQDVMNTGVTETGIPEKLHKHSTQNTFCDAFNCLCFYSQKHNHEIPH